MEKAISVLAMIVVVLTCHVAGQATLKIGFGEVDFYEEEGAGNITVSIIKEGQVNFDLHLNIIPLTFEQFDRRGYEVPEERKNVSRPDPAEFEGGLNGRRDFDNTIREVIIRPTSTRDDYTVVIPITSDFINEADEGFMVVMRANEDRSNAVDIENLEFLGNGVTLAVIRDDDPITIGFQLPQYTFKEDAGYVDDVIYVIKQEGDVTEQILPLVVSPFSITAMPGTDYDVQEEISLEFQPEVLMLPVPIRLLNDSVPEPDERFQLVLSRIEDAPTIDLIRDLAFITIQDDDEVEIGFERAVYSVNEGETVLVCVTLNGPEVIDDDFSAFAFISTVPGTATEDVDFVVLNNEFAILTSELRSRCYSVQTLTDVVFEGTENLTVTLEPNRLFTPGNVIVGRDEVTILINSDECLESSNDCDENAECTDTVEGFECSCLPGFTGDGRTCLDTDQCSLGTDDCNKNLFCQFGSDAKLACNVISACRSTPGSFECVCHQGYTGDGYTCKDLNECATGDANCDANANCLNLPGSYACNCRLGFEGNGVLCTDVNECAEGSNECNEFADCINTEGSYECQCREGFTGDGRTCVAEAILPNDCRVSSSNCGQNAVCIDSGNGYECQCRDGFTGDGQTCVAEAILANDCRIGGNDCGLNAVCIDSGNGNECQCEEGFSGDGITCRDINECKAGTFDCPTNSRCENTFGSYVCVCRRGYVRNGRTCIDCDECAEDMHLCHRNARCVNTPGSYRCICNRGFRGNGRNCRDINECAEGRDNCHQNALCVNRVGRFTCRCRPGFVGNGVTCTAQQPIAMNPDSVQVSPPCVSDEPVGTSNTHRTKSSKYSTTKRSRRYSTTKRGRRSRSSTNTHTNDGDLCGDHSSSSSHSTTGKTHSTTGKTHSTTRTN